MSGGLSGNLDVLFNKMENFISTKTVVGEPIHIAGVIIVPFVDVSFGVGVGASSGNDDKNKENGGGGGGGGLGGKITPTAVLVVIDGAVQMISVKNEDSVKKLIDLAPGIVSKLNLGSLFSKKKDCEKKQSKVEFEETRVSESFNAAEESLD
ncbi:MAG: sporulation protein [Clostridiales bacterium]|jgi:uncharacterized spore protein YtfJ|nr:sporulation protein [Clostridiales bacterium]